ncbi:Shu complex component Csm2, DNA-binding [Nakaseomyces glabratus]
MPPKRYDDLSLLTLWPVAPDIDLAQYIYQFLTSEVGTQTEKEVYFTDSINSFPIHQLQELVNESNQSIYENIKINTALDLHELSSIIKKNTESLILKKIQNKKTNDLKPFQILSVINGLDVMFRSTLVSFTNEQAHLMLRDVMLRLRQVCNEYDCSPLTFKIILLFNRSDVMELLPKQRHSATHQQKKMKYNNAMEGNSVGEFVGKYYCDEVAQ